LPSPASRRAPQLLLLRRVRSRTADSSARLSSGTLRAWCLNQSWFVTCLDEAVERRSGTDGVSGSHTFLGQPSTASRSADAPGSSCADEEPKALCSTHPAGSMRYQSFQPPTS
jgi:hypothetical protein